MTAAPARPVPAANPCKTGIFRPFEPERSVRAPIGIATIHSRGPHMNKLILALSLAATAAAIVPAQAQNLPRAMSTLQAGSQ